MDFNHILNHYKFDLHLHTTASDGVLSPKKLVKKAAELGLEIIAITDHDTVDGIEEALSAAKEYGVTVIPGIELSTKYKGKSIDILGYGIIPSEDLMETLVKLREERRDRGRRILSKFNQLGMNITLEDVKKHSKGDVIARPHIARAVVDKGYAKDMQMVFDLYLADGKPCDVAKSSLLPNDAISVIHESGGKAFLAHPRLIGDERLVEELMAFPFDGIEVWHRKHKAGDRKRYRLLAEKYGKLMSGGSDYHNEEHLLGEFGFSRENR